MSEEPYKKDMSDAMSVMENQLDYDPSLENRGDITNETKVKKIKTKRQPKSILQEATLEPVEPEKRKFCISEITLYLSVAALAVLFVSTFLFGDYNAKSMANDKIAQCNGMYEQANASLKNVTTEKETCMANMVEFKQMAYSQLCQPLPTVNGTYAMINAACSPTQNVTWIRVK